MPLLTADHWNTTGVELAVAVQQAAKISQKTVTDAQVSAALWNIVEKMKPFLTAMRKAEALWGDLSSLGDETAKTCEWMQNILVKFRPLEHAIDSLVDKARHFRGMNSSLINTVAQALTASNTELSQFLDAIELGLDPQTKVLIAEAHRDIENGDTVSLEALL